MAKVEAPNKEYNGPGPGGATFENGVAHVEDEGALNYYRRAGYTVDGEGGPAAEPEPADPRDIEDTVVGTRLRDAAVDPDEGDFLAPINAGEANPHGAAVVAPEIHGSGPKGIRPGDAAVDNLGKQERREKEHAQARLIDRKPAPEVVDGEVETDDRGPLGFSDPGSAEVGRQEAGGDGVPKQSDNKAAWVDYAVEQGADRDEAQGMTKAELADRYGA